MHSFNIKEIIAIGSFLKINEAHRLESISVSTKVQWDFIVLLFCMINFIRIWLVIKLTNGNMQILIKLNSHKFTDDKDTMRAL